MEKIDKKILIEYAELKATEKATKARILELAPLIKSSMGNLQADKIESDVGVFTLKLVPVWKYSAAVEEAEKKVDDLKANEKADGTATMENRTDLMFKEPKADS